jgi:phosphoribosylformimino-5-aminoimidazole carboxamide ribotide isomerase
MLRIIPVLDVRRGRAVHARGGRRDDYLPVRSTLRRGSAPLALAAATRDALGLRELYLADLAAIEGEPPDTGLYRGLAGLGLEVWADAGLREGTDAASLLEAGVGRLVAGLETVAGPRGLRSLVEAAGTPRVVFCLDLREGRPVVASRADWGTDDPRGIAERAIREGVRSVILLDLARVGSGRGPGTDHLLGPLAREFPAVEWIVGGGIAGRDDLKRLADAGASAALVASAIHDGRIGPTDIMA